jgi:hypothetical protein
MLGDVMPNVALAFARLARSCNSAQTTDKLCSQVDAFGKIYGFPQTRSSRELGEAGYRRSKESASENSSVGYGAIAAGWRRRVHVQIGLHAERLRAVATAIDAFSKHKCSRRYQE